jgi:hypothetical protein
VASYAAPMGSASTFLAQTRAMGKSIGGSMVFQPKHQRAILRDRRCLFGPVLLLANRIYTFTVMPTNERLMATPEAEANAETAAVPGRP